jgi:hypothetical protein
VIWWLWTAYVPTRVQVIDLAEWWDCDEPDVEWLGECAWTGRVDNAGTGLR